MTTATLAAKLIRSFEGCRLTAYWDPTGKVWTIGFGHTKKVTNGDKITIDQAEAFLAEDAAALVNLVKDRPMIEAAALVSFGYNCGIGALLSVLGGRIRIENGSFVGQAGLPYGETSAGQRLPGLVARRALEAALIEASRGLS